MEKIIFLDFDGVLNCTESFKKNNMERLFYGRLSPLNFELLTKWLMTYYDDEKIEHVKIICRATGALVVAIGAAVTSIYWPLVEEALTERGLHIVDVRPKGVSRGEFISEYVAIHGITDYIVLDDEIFPDYDEEIIAHLVKTDYYNGGLSEEAVEEAIRTLGAREKTLEMKYL